MTQRLFINEQSSKILVLDEDGGIEVFSLHDPEQLVGNGAFKELRPTEATVATSKKIKIHIHEGNIPLPKTTDQMQKIADKFNSGMNANEVVEATGLTLGTVYQLKAKAKKAGLLKEKDITPVKVNATNAKFEELVRAYGRKKVEMVRNMYQCGDDAQKIADDIDIGLDLHHVQTIIDRLEL